MVNPKGDSMKTLKGFVQYLRDNTDKIDQQHACYVQSIGNKCCFLTHAGIYFDVAMRPVLPVAEMLVSDYTMLRQIPLENRGDKQIIYAADGYDALITCLKEQLDDPFPSLECSILDATDIFDDDDDPFTSEPWPMHPADVLTAAYPELLTDETEAP